MTLFSLKKMIVIDKNPSVSARGRKTRLDSLEDEEQKFHSLSYESSDEALEQAVNRQPLQLQPSLLGSFQL